MWLPAGIIPGRMAPCTTSQPQKKMACMSSATTGWPGWTGLGRWSLWVRAAGVSGRMRTMRYINYLRRPKKAAPTEEVYMYDAYERFWHWLQTMIIVLLLFTGLVIHRPDIFGIVLLPLHGDVHNVLAVILVINAALSLFWHLASGEIRQFIPRPMASSTMPSCRPSTTCKASSRANEHPFEKTKDKKLNPLQQVTYFGLLNVLLPLQIITGALMWGVQQWPQAASLFGGLPFLAPFHSLVAWLFASFIVAHVYLTTTGVTVFDDIQAMVTGWEQVEVHHDDEAGQGQAGQPDAPLGEYLTYEAGDEPSDSPMNRLQIDEHPAQHHMNPRFPNSMEVAMTVISETVQPKGSQLESLPVRPAKEGLLASLSGRPVLGLVLFLAFFLTGNGLGASGGLNRIVVFVEDLIVPEHVDRVPYLLKLAGGDKNPLDDWIIPMVFGTLVGGFVSGWLNGRLQVETNKGPQHLRPHPLADGLYRRRSHGLWGAHGARLHLRPGALRRRSALGGIVGFHVRRVCRRLRPGLLRPQAVALIGGCHVISLYLLKPWLASR